MTSPPAAPQLLQFQLTASDTAGLDFMGADVDVSGGTLVASAYSDDHAGGDDAGPAYVFVRQGGVWLEQAKLVDSNAAEDDHFGGSIALDGDTLVVGVQRWGRQRRVRWRCRVR